ncbi:hypothetical protein ACQPYE_01000 [Actinosynnema sp. CA-299493]
MSLRLIVFMWITGVLAPSTFITLVLSGYPLVDAASASGLMAVAAAEIAVRLFNTPGAGGAGGQLALGPAPA